MPPKRGRRGSGAAGEEGTSTTSRGGGVSGGGRARRLNSSSASGDADAGGGGSRGGSSGGGGGGDQLLLRDRRSRIAARTLRSSGSIFDMGSIVKGIGSSWLSGGGEQAEELRVVRVEERDALVEPPVAPPVLVAFLETRRTRRDREVSGGDGRATPWIAYSKRV